MHKNLLAQAVRDTREDIVILKESKTLVRTLEISVAFDRKTQELYETESGFGFALRVVDLGYANFGTHGFNFSRIAHAKSKAVVVYAKREKTESGESSVVVENLPLELRGIVDSEDAANLIAGFYNRAKRNRSRRDDTDTSAAFKELWEKLENQRKNERKTSAS